MRFSSWDSLGLSFGRMLLAVLLVGLFAGGAVLLATFEIFGTASVLLCLVVGGLAAYVVAGIPKRVLDRAAVMQARDAPVLAASAAIFLESTGSRSKTVMMLRSPEPRLSTIIEQAKRSTLLGKDTSAAFTEAAEVRADSVLSILGSIVRAEGGRLSDEGEELEGMVRASLSVEETKFPVFLAVSFFLPIMLMILAAIGHHDQTFDVVSLAFVEIIVLDLALSFSSTERRRLS